MTLADLMILIGANAVSLACCILVDNNLYGGGRYFFGVFNWSATTWNSSLLLDKAEGAFALGCALFGTWTMALPVIGFRRPRAEHARLLRGPGLTACLGASTGIAFCIGATLLAFALRWIDGRLNLPANFWYSTPILESLFILGGVGVASTWAAQLATGRWRPAPHAIDRLGRFMGALWLSAGLVFAVRLYLG
jgi:hypothetical protein